MRPVASGLSPNTQKDDIAKAFSLIFTFWEYLSGESIKNLEQWFRQYFKVSHAVSFVSGRGALYAILKTLGVSKGDEVIVQGFTCVVVVNPILALGGKPIFVDTTKNLTIDPLDLQKKITKNTKAIIVQHTFGIPADMKEILKIAGTIPVIEDVAHTIGGTYRGKKLGTFGKAALFSFGRDKAFSSVFGGMAITNDEELGKKLRLFQKQLSFPSMFFVFQQLMHPLLFSVLLPLYDFFHIGKIILVIAQKLKIVSFPVEQPEKKGKIQQIHIQKMPNALAGLALFQLKKIKEYNDIREYAAKEYMQNLDAQFYQFPALSGVPFLRFPVFVKNPDSLVGFAKRHGVYLGRWYSEIVDPKDTDFDAIEYTKGSCMTAEECAKQVVNLPTYPTMTEKNIKKVIILLNAYAKNYRNNK